MISFSFLLFFVFFFISQYTCIGGGSWFEGKRSLEKRSKQCGIQCGIRWHSQSNCGFKRLRRSLSNLSNERLEALERFLLPENTENTSVSDRQLENFDFSDDVPEKKEWKSIKNLTKKRSWKTRKQNKLKNITMSHLYVRPYNHQ